MNGDRYKDTLLKGLNIFFIYITYMTNDYWQLLQIIDKRQFYPNEKKIINLIAV